MKIIKKIYIPVSLLLIAGCSGKTETAAGAEQEISSTGVSLTEAQLRNAGIVAEKLKTGILTTVLKLNGIIEAPPQNRVTISAPMGGFLRSSALVPGMSVKKGDRIAVMEDQQYVQLQQDYLTTAVKLRMLEAEYNRQQELNKSKAGSDKVLQQAESEYRSQRISLKALAEKLRLIGINPDNLNEGNISRSIGVYSPINGYVSRVFTNSGKYVNAADVMFELINPDNLYLNLKMYEQDMDKIQTGQEVIAWTNAEPEKKYNCRVFLIDRAIGDDRSMDVRCRFDGGKPSLVPGLYMNAEITAHTDSGYIIPDEALISSGNQTYCFVQKSPGNFELMPIRKEASAKGFTSIAGANNEDLSALDIVIKGAYTLWMELKKEKD